MAVVEMIWQVLRTQSGPVEDMKGMNIEWKE
jgi:hypothetical protein